MSPDHPPQYATPDEIVLLYKTMRELRPVLQRFGSPRIVMAACQIIGATEAKVGLGITLDEYVAATRELLAETVWNDNPHAPTR